MLIITILLIIYFCEIVKLLTYKVSFFVKRQHKKMHNV